LIVVSEGETLLVVEIVPFGNPDSVGVGVVLARRVFEVAVMAVVRVSDA
jgi:hypothetical protein